MDEIISWKIIFPVLWNFLVGCNFKFWECYSELNWAKKTPSDYSNGQLVKNILFHLFWNWRIDCWRNYSHFWISNQTKPIKIGYLSIKRNFLYFSVRNRRNLPKKWFFKSLKHLNTLKYIYLSLQWIWKFKFFGIHLKLFHFYSQNKRKKKKIRRKFRTNATSDITFSKKMDFVRWLFHWRI